MNETDPTKPNKAKIEYACTQLLKGILGCNVFDDENFEGTPERMARMYMTMISPKEEIQASVDKFLAKSFPSDYDGIVLLPNIVATSFCPHHMLPVEYTVHIGYIRGNVGKQAVIGASKPERVCREFGKYPYLQETFTREISLDLQDAINAQGVAVVVKGKHNCMRVRGIKNPCANMVTSMMLGSFKENVETRNEFFHLLDLGRE